MAITAAHETTCARTTLDPGMKGRHIQHRGAEIIVTACASRFGRVQSQEKKSTTAIVATTTVRAISTTIATVKDRRSDDHCLTATAATGAKPRAVNKLFGHSRSLNAL